MTAFCCVVLWDSVSYPKITLLPVMLDLPCLPFSTLKLKDSLDSLAQAGNAFHSSAFFQRAKKKGFCTMEQTHCTFHSTVILISWDFSFWKLTWKHLRSVKFQPCQVESLKTLVGLCSSRPAGLVFSLLRSKTPLEKGTIYNRKSVTPRRWAF